MSSFRLQIDPAGWQADASPDLTLLDAALLAGIVLPNSCRNGTCRTCLCRMTAGSVRYTIEWPGLSKDEKMDGDILPCVAQPLSDVTLAVPDARRIVEKA